MLRAQFWTLAQSKYISEGIQKWTLLGSKVVPPGRPVFGPVILSDVLAAMCAKCQAWSYVNTNSIRGRNLELGRPVFASLIFLAFSGPKIDPSEWQAEVRAVQTTISWTPELAQVHVTGPASPPSPPKQRLKCRCCKESLFHFSQSLFGGLQGNVPKFEKLWRMRFQSNHRWNNSAVNFYYFASKNR